jgi:Ice-binding-like
MTMIRPSRPALGLLALAPVLAVVLASTTHANPAGVLLGSADSYAVLAGSTITNTGPTVINGDLGLHPGIAVTGFPPGTIHGVTHLHDAAALKAKTDLASTAYADAAARPITAKTPPNLGGRSLGAGVYRTGSVASLGLTGKLTLDGQGDPHAVFIFQIESTLITAADSRVNLVNGAQACNVYWQVGSSATLGARTAFKGNVMALASISLDNRVAVDGSLLARTGAVTLINDTVTRSRCLPGTGPASGIGTALGPISGSGRGPLVRISQIPGTRRSTCAGRDFTARFRVRDHTGLQRAEVYLDRKLVHRTARTRFAVRIRVSHLRPRRHKIAVFARDRAGNLSVTKRRFMRCAPR